MCSPTKFRRIIWKLFMGKQSSIWFFFPLFGSGEKALCCLFSRITKIWAMKHNFVSNCAGLTCRRHQKSRFQWQKQIPVEVLELQALGRKKDDNQVNELRRTAQNIVNSSTKCWRQISARKHERAPNMGWWLISVSMKCTNLPTENQYNHIYKNKGNVEACRH